MNTYRVLVWQRNPATSRAADGAMALHMLLTRALLNVLCMPCHATQLTAWAAAWRWLPIKAQFVRGWAHFP
jgi:hypothetical protein